MKDCPNCGATESMYRALDNQKCYNCDYTHEYKLIGDTVPTREAKSKCGDIISSAFDGVSRAIVRKGNCVDGSTCSITPKGIKKLKGDKYMVVCSFHDDD